MTTTTPSARYDKCQFSLKASAFTLVELLTVIAIVGILTAIIIPTVGMVRKTARASQCKSNLRQIGIAASLYHVESKNMTPPFGAVYYQALWPYASSAKYTNATSQNQDLPNNLANTIFECPSAQDDNDPSITIKRSYGMNSQLIPTAPNRSTNGAPIREIQNPSKVAYFSDTKNSSGLYNLSNGVKTANPRHDAKLHVCYMDGHVESITLTTSLSASTTDQFWTGVP